MAFPIRKFRDAKRTGNRPEGTQVLYKPVFICIAQMFTVTTNCVSNDWEPRRRETENYIFDRQIRLRDSISWQRSWGWIGTFSLYYAQFFFIIIQSRTNIWTSGHFFSIYFLLFNANWGKLFLIGVFCLRLKDFSRWALAVYKYIYVIKNPLLCIKNLFFVIYCQ